MVIEKKMLTDYFPETLAELNLDNTFQMVDTLQFWKTCYSFWEDILNFTWVYDVTGLIYADIW